MVVSERVDSGRGGTPGKLFWCIRWARLHNATRCIVLGAPGAAVAMGPRDHRADILDGVDTCSDLWYRLARVIFEWRAHTVGQANQNIGLRPSRS